MEYQFFPKIDENHCMNLACHQNHKIRKNGKKLGMYRSDMSYIESFEVFKCQLRERKQSCNFCKKCFDCRRFKILCYDWYGIVTNSNRKYGIHCSAMRFCQRNLRYRKTECMTVDFLNSGVVDKDFINL